MEDDEDTVSKEKYRRLKTEKEHFHTEMVIMESRLETIATALEKIEDAADRNDPKAVKHWVDEAWRVIGPR